VARRSDNTRNLEFVMYRTPPTFSSGRAIAGWVVAFVLMAVAGTASAQVTAVTGTSCQTPVLQNPSTLNPLRLQAGTVSFELWGTTSITATNATSMFQLTGLQSVELLALRTATQNAARGCPSVPSASLRVRTADTITETVSGTLRVPYGKSGQSIALRVVPYPSIAWIWAQTPVGATTPCVMPTFDFQYSPNTVLNLKIPFNAPLGVECKQQLSSRIFAGKSDAHIVGPVPVRLTTQLTGLSSVDLPVPIAPESTIPSQVSRPGSAVTVPVLLSKNGVLRRQRDFPLAITTPNGETAQLMASIVRKPPEGPKITISTRSASGETPDVFTGTAIDFTFGIQPAVQEFSLPITWRVTNPTCFAAVSGPYNPANPFQVFNLQQGGTIFNIRVQALHTAACIPPDGGRTETIQAWAGTDTSVPPAGTVTFKVLRNPSL